MRATNQEGERLLEALHRTGAIMAAEGDLERVMQAATDAAREITGAAWAAFFYSHPSDGPGGGRLEVFAVSGAGRDGFRGFGMPRETPLFAHTMSRGETVRVDDVLADPRFGSRGGMPPGHLPVRSYLGVAVGSAAEGRAVAGTLLLGHPEPCAFRPRHARLAEAIASQAAVAIDNSRLRAELGAFADSLERRVEDGMRALRESEARRLREAAAREAESRSEERFREMADELPLLCWMAEPDGHIFWYNRRWYEYTGSTRAEMEGWGWRSVHHPDALPGVMEAWNRSLSTGELFEIVFPLRGADAVFRPHMTRAIPFRDESGAVTRWFGTNTEVRDLVESRAVLERLVEERTAALRQEVDERREAEGRMRHAQKMEAIGILAGGVAHDFNNCAAAALAGLSLFDKRHGALVEGEPRARFLLDGVRTACARGGGTARRLLAFARRDELDTAPVAAREVLSEMRDGPVAATMVASGVSLRTMPEPWPDLVFMADKAQLAAVLACVAANARDAMAPGGVLSFSIRRDTVSDQRVPGLFGGDYARLDVTDTGRGMDPETLRRATEPFFTTKPPGDGTGLGLSTALGFAEQSGGSLRIVSAPGEGTTVSIWLPLAPP